MLACSLLGGVVGQNECPGRLAEALASCLLPGHPPFACLQHIHPHTSILWHGWAEHRSQPKLAQCMERSFPRTCTPSLVFSPPKWTAPIPKPICLPGPALAPRWDLILAMLLQAVCMASECWKLLSVAMRGNSLAQESSSSGREQVVSLPEETDTPTL